MGNSIGRLNNVQDIFQNPRNVYKMGEYELSKMTRHPVSVDNEKRKRDANDT